MAGTSLGAAAFSFLLYASVIQGLPNVGVHHSETTEVGQDVTLPCIMNITTNLKIAAIEWRKTDIKLALYNPKYGAHQFWPNITIEAVINREKELIGSYLHLLAVNEWDSGVYICDITGFPYGTITTETELKIKGLAVPANTCPCADIPPVPLTLPPPNTSCSSTFRYTCIDGYVRQVGHSNLIRCLEDNGVMRWSVPKLICTRLPTLSPRSTVTEEGLTEPAESSFNTSSSATEFYNTSVTWTMSTGTDAPDHSPGLLRLIVILIFLCTCVCLCCVTVFSAVS